MRRHRAYANIQRLIEDLKACQRLHGKIIGQVKQLPRDWFRSAEQAGRSEVFHVLCENYFKPSMLDKVDLSDFVKMCKSLKDYEGGPLL